MPLTGEAKAPRFSRLGAVRLGAIRLGYIPLAVSIYVNGVARQTGVRVTAITVSDDLNHAPNTASFRCSGFAPLAGQAVAIYLGTLDLDHQLFGGSIISVATAYESLPARVIYECHCIDWTWLLGRRTVLTRYVGDSATAIVQNLIANYSGGFTTVHVAAGMPTIDEITFTNEDLPTAITRVMERVGGYWYVDYARDVHAFLTEATAAHPITQAAPNTMADISMSTDLSQVATYVTARGYGENALEDVPAGANTIPLADTDLKYSASGGYVQARQQYISYAAFVQGGAGASAGSASVSAPSAPTVALNAAVGILQGTYQYAVTFVQGSAETVPSAASSVVTAGFPTPTAAPYAISEDWYGNNTKLASMRLAYSYRTAAGETPIGPASAAIVISNYGNDPVGGYTLGGAIRYSVATGPTGTTGRRMYKSVNGGAWGYIAAWSFANVETDNVTTDTIDYGAVPGAAPLSVSTAGGSKVDVTIPLGPAGTTARRIYRTTVAGSVFLLVKTINDNTTTVYTDNARDADLAGSAPLATTYPTPAASATLAVADLSVFPAAGWARVGQQLIRYTGRSGSSGAGTLTGIPATGIGALAAPVLYGADVLVVPHLTGVAGIWIPLLKGDPVQIIVQAFDYPRVTAMAALVGGDGLHEYFISDGRWSITEALAQAQAALRIRSNPLVTVNFVSRDPSLSTGREVTITLTSPPISGTFRIQRVTISDLGETTVVLPLRRVECSSVRYSLEDLLRSIRSTR